ncbi:1-2-dihydroxy-3-keto-5-methylthiopentene dioxygenase [Fragilaria crotonensis]|nr:1-2-dihydroxy-3-keto-5-methylthiopentene dioxygenase [Fragilaria crotonensis]
MISTSATANDPKRTPLPEASPEGWPEAWRIPDSMEDQFVPNKLEPNISVSVEELKDIGICYWKMDAESYKYPIHSVPWDPNDATDPRLQQLRDDRGYSYADIITVHPDHLPDFDLKVKAFFEEHIHDAEEIRYVLGGSGYFDVRDLQDRWVRIHVTKGDLITLPEGIYHRFTCDSDRVIHIMRLFVGLPIWTPFNRPCDEHPSRQKYVEHFPAIDVNA